MLYSTPQTDISDIFTSQRFSDLRHPHKLRPFVTISRQPGAGGFFGPLLAKHLNTAFPAQNQPAWQCLNRELVERIAEDQHLSTTLINSLQQSSHSFIAEFLKGLHFRDDAPPSDFAIIRRIAETMRALAQSGNVILVGLGGVFMTKNMPAALHIRIIAPLDHRIKNVAAGENLTENEARQFIKQRDHDRQSFFHAYWPNQHLSDDLFHLTLNSSLLTETQMAEAVHALLMPLMN